MNKEKNNQRGIIMVAATALAAIVMVLSVLYSFTMRAWEGVGPILQVAKSLLRAGTLDQNCAKFTENSKKYIAMINEASAKYGVNPALVAGMIEWESGWKSGAASGADAHGLMQTIPETFAKYRDPDKPNDMNNPEASIFAGTNYIGSMIKQFNGDLDKALAAYNAGPGAVEKYGGIPPYSETQEYVPGVKSMYQKYLDCSKEKTKTTTSATEIITGATK